MRFNSMRVSRAFRVFVCWVTGIGGRAERRISSVVSVGYQDAPGAKVRAPHALARATSVTRGNPAVVCVPEMELRPVATDHFRAPDTSMARFGLLLRLMSEPPPMPPLEAVEFQAGGAPSMAPCTATTHVHVHQLTTSGLQKRKWLQYLLLRWLVVCIRFSM